MASGKKGKKNKGKTLALTEFLQEKTGTITSLPIRKSTSNWADEVEEFDGYESRYKVNVVLPTAPKASRDFDDVETKVPKEPPFTAYLSNLPYDVEEDEVSEIFKGLKISSLTIPKDERGEPPKRKGHAYVEFEDRESLMSALIIPDITLKSRRIRIEVSTSGENDRRRGRMDMNRGGDRSDRSDTFSGDWRSGPRTENSDMDRRGGYNSGSGGGGGGGFTRGGGDRDGFTRGSDREHSGFTRDRDSGFNRDFNRDREGGFSRDRDSNEQSSGSWRSERINRNTDRSFNRNRFDDREERGDRRGGYGHRRFENNDRDDRNNGHNNDEQQENRQRPKLNLAPRTKPVENVETVPSSSASIFGNAKPVDTSLRERQIEEKLAKEQETIKEVLKEKRSGSGSENGDKKPLEKSRPSRRVESPAREPLSTDNRKNDEEEKKLAPAKVEQQKDLRNEKPRRDEKKDKEMPKLKEQEPPNFIGNNKYAYLENEDNSE